uniref:Si:ch211-131k2.2 n=1 Tax=Sinocyclocheilus anshuiensis TaxID=1608454 RepID=A0A671RHT1_9TELE
MEIWKLSVLMLTILAFACSVQGLSFTLNRDPWISDNWEDEPVEETLASQVASLLKRSKSHQFYGLMGKRSEVFQPVKMQQRSNFTQVSKLNFFRLIYIYIYIYIYKGLNNF